MKFKGLKFKKVLSGAMGAAVMLTSVCSTSFMQMTATASTVNNYGEALKLSLYFFDSNECGTEVGDNALTWRGDCHTYDANAALSQAVNFNSNYTSIVDPDGDGCVDVSGGYHDAGDHIKFNLTNGFAASSLAMSYYLNDGAYEKAGCEAHLDQILRKMSSYLMKTTFLNSDGSVATICYNVSDSSDHNYWQAPEVQSYPRKTYWMSSSNNNISICGEMAAGLAGAAYVLKDSDPAYAAECLKYAKAIYTFGTKYSGNETSGMGGMYGTESDPDELALASAWLYINGESSKPTYTPTGNGCYSNQYYDYHYYCWNKVWSGYSALMYKKTGETSFKNEMQFELNNKGGVPTNKYNATDQGSWGGSRYNCALQMLALGVADGDANSQYAQGAKYQMDYLLGNNSLGYSFLIGYGNKWPVHIHHRAANPGDSDANKSADVSGQNTVAKYTNYGMLVGGPSDSNGTYSDVTNSYQYTEPALDYNSCFALACAGLVNLYGNGSSTSMVNWSASEFVQGYNFGGGTTPIETTTPETTTETTTTETTTTQTTTTETTTPETTKVTETTTVPETTTTSNTTTNVQPTMKGDVNGDGRVTVADVILINKYMAGMANLSAQQIANADVTNDGKVNNIDGLKIMKLIGGLISNL